MPNTNRWPTWSLIKLITTTTGRIITRSYINIIWVRVWGLLKLLSNLSSSTSSSNNTRPSRTRSTSSPSWTTTTSLTICHDWPWWLASSNSWFDYQIYIGINIPNSMASISKSGSNTWDPIYGPIFGLYHKSSKNVVWGIICDDLQNVLLPHYCNHVIQKLK